MTNVKFVTLQTPVKSDNDKKRYKVIRLENGLTVCLASKQKDSSKPSEDLNEIKKNEELKEKEDKAKEPEMAAASLCINVGGFSDPKKVPGMAHFLEHMVFMGSEKYPEENDFSAFISNMGGYYNAQTEENKTTFYFDCLEEKFYTALDKFAQFFIAPLMKKDSISRERESIDSEFQMALPCDELRTKQLIYNFAKSDCPFNSMFMWGNIETLKNSIPEDELYDGVHEFRKRHYSAHRMTLAVQGPFPMEVLESYVLECFTEIPTNNEPPDDFKQFTEVFDTHEFSKIYYIEPLSESREVTLRWELPPLLHKYKSKPHDYLARLIGDEAKGSLLSYLMRKKLWVLSLYAGASDEDLFEMCTMFGIQMTLTEEGLNHLSEVIQTVYSYIKMLKEVGPQKWFYEEIKTINENNFKFAKEQDPIYCVRNLSKSMQLFPPEDYISGSVLTPEYDPDDIIMLLNHFVPQKMNIVVLCSSLPDSLSYDKKEKWFRAKYTKREIPVDWIEKWENAPVLQELSLPPPNKFIAENFAILTEDENHPDFPEKIFCNETVELWYRKDQTFKLPNACYCFKLISPLSGQSPLTDTLIEYLGHLLRLQLTEDVYPATLAGLSYSVYDAKKGILLDVEGYNEKLPMLMEVLTEHLINFSSLLTEEMFQAVKDKLKKHYYNILLSPNNLEWDVNLNLKVTNHHSYIHRYNICSDITLENVKDFAKEFFKKIYAKVLVQGNVSKEVAINVVDTFTTRLNYVPLDFDNYPEARAFQFPKGESVCKIESFNTKDSNSVISNYYQFGPYSLKDKVLINLIIFIINEPLFNTLRTKEQLGYSVTCFLDEDEGILGFSINVNTQATRKSTEYVKDRIDEFVKQCGELFANMSDETFETTKKDFITKKEIKDVELFSEIIRNWREIDEGEYMFDRWKKEIATAKQITLDDIKCWWKEYTGEQNNMRKLNIQVVGFKTDDGDVSEDNEKETSLSENIKGKQSLKFVNFETEKENDFYYIIKNINTYKKQLYLYPVIRPTFKELEKEKY